MNRSIKEIIQDKFRPKKPPPKLKFVTEKPVKITDPTEEEKKPGPKFKIMLGIHEGKRFDEVKYSTLKSWCIITANKMRKGLYKKEEYDIYKDILKAARYYFDNYDTFMD